MTEEYFSLDRPSELCLNENQKGGVVLETINDRIAWVISRSGLTKTAFAEKLNVSQSFISKLAIGVSTPSDRTIGDICREFNINEIWLRTGEGDPVARLEREDEIASWIGKVLAGNDDFKKDFVAVLSRLDENAWAVLAQISEQMVEQRRRHEEGKKNESEL